MGFDLKAALMQSRNLATITVITICCFHESINDGVKMDGTIIVGATKLWETKSKIIQGIKIMIKKIKIVIFFHEVGIW